MKRRASSHRTRAEQRPFCFRFKRLIDSGEIQQESPFSRDLESLLGLPPIVPLDARAMACAYRKDQRWNSDDTPPRRQVRIMLPRCSESIVLPQSGNERHIRDAIAECDAFAQKADVCCRTAEEEYRLVPSNSVSCERKPG